MTTPEEKGKGRTSEDGAWVGKLEVGVGGNDGLAEGTKRRDWRRPSSWG